MKRVAYVADLSILNNKKVIRISLSLVNHFFTFDTMNTSFSQSTHSGGLIGSWRLWKRTVQRTARVLMEVATRAA